MQTYGRGNVTSRLWGDREETKDKSISVLVGAQIPSSFSGISEREIPGFAGSKFTHRRSANNCKSPVALFAGGTWNMRGRFSISRSRVSKRPDKNYREPSSKIINLADSLVDFIIFFLTRSLAGNRLDVAQHSSNQSIIQKNS